MKVTLKLTLLERFQCLGVFNNIEGADLVEWGFIQEAQDLLAADDETKKKYDMKRGEDGVGWIWNEKGDKEEAYEFSPEAAEVLKKDIKRRNDGKKIPRDFVALARKVLA